MPRLSFLVISLFVLPASFLVGQSGIPPSAPGGLVEPTPASLVVELDRAIVVLKRGIREGWETRDRYLTAFERTSNTDPTGHSVTEAKKYVECAIGERFRIHQIWDEGSPIEVEAHGAVLELTKWRKEAAAEHALPPCPVPLPRRVRVSAGVAADMLKTKVEPVYPGDVRVSGTVTVHAIISTEGHVESLNVVSDPAILYGAALDAVRQWTFRPYLLNNLPVEVETTINVVFPPSH